MAGQSADRYPSTKFLVLTDSESIANAKKNYLTWIISGTILFGITVGFLCHKIFVAPTYFNDTLTQFHEDTTQQSTEMHPPKTSAFTLPHSDVMFRKRLSKGQSDFFCDQSETKSEAVPLMLRKRILEKLHFEDVKDVISAELLIHYENIINDYDWEYLKSLFNKYKLKILEMKTCVDFLNFLQGLKSNKFKFYIKYLKTQRLELNLKDFDWFFSLTEELSHWYNYLSRLRTYVSDYDHQVLKKNFRNITETNFSEFTQETYRKLFHFIYPFSVTEKKLLELNQILNEWAKPAEVEIKNCSVTLFKRAVLLSEVREYLSSLKKTCVENVYIYASVIIYLDSDLELFGVNLAIISPVWKFLKKVKINLNGTAGESHPNAASRDQDGKPGNPGSNGGDFLAVGDFEKTFLTVSVNGGVGGAGQNGATGRDGINNSRPDPRLDKPVCAIKTETFSNLKLFNITHYKIYGEDGCGGPGTNGGVGGYGGHGGVITLLNKDGVKITRGLSGAPGRPGKGGAGGTGGRDGCFYGAVDENDEFLHPVTTVKCLAGIRLPSGQAGKDGYNDLGQILPSPKKNLLVHDAVFRYIRLSEQHFIKYNNPPMSFLRILHTSKKTIVEDALEEFKLIEGFERLEYYEIFYEFLQSFHTSENKNARLLVNYLKSIALGKITYLMNNVKYFFVDWKSYLNIIETSIKNTNETTHKLEAVDYFKRKVHVKIDEIRQTLKLLKEKSKISVDGRKHLPQGLTEEMRLSCVMTITIDAITYFLHDSDELSQDLNDTLNLCSVNLQQPQIISGKNDLTNAEEVLLKTLQSLFSQNKLGIRECLVELRDALDSLKDSYALPEEKKYSLQAVVDEVEHFTALYYFVKWERVENIFSRSLENITRDESENQSDEIAFLRDRLKDTMVSVQIKLVEDSSTQNRYSLSALQPRRKTLSDVITQLNLSNDARDRSPFCNNHVKAIFERNSILGPFFSWPNGQIKNKLKLLFLGTKIELKADLVNRHVLDKSFVQFSSLRLEFNCTGEETFCKKLQDILLNFKIDITHSGYSYYNWRDKTRIVVSEKVTLSYNFRTRDNQEPELYNAFFKKCQEGEIRLSPFTTWTVQLFPLNEDANFKELAPFADFTSLHLIGTGTYIVDSS